jgi:hypothetical protein
VFVVHPARRRRPRDVRLSRRAGCLERPALSPAGSTGDVRRG